jgi:hypothetical protein
MVNGEWDTESSACRLTIADSRLRFTNLISNYDTCIADSYSVGEWFAFVPHKGGKERESMVIVYIHFNDGGGYIGHRFFA